jgi:hypothetical protein
MHDNDRFVLVSKFSQDLDDSSLGGGVDPGHRLIHEVNICGLDERPGQEHTLLLSAAELAYLPIGKAAHVDLVERCQSALPLSFSGSSEPAEMTVKPHRDDIERGGGEIPIDRGALGNIAYQSSLLSVRFSVDIDVTRRRFDQSEDGLDKRTFSCTVRSNDSCEYSRGDIHIDIP